MPVERIFHRLGIHRGAVMELHPRAQIDPQRRRVLIGIAGGELRDDLQLLVDVEQLVAHRGEHDPTDIGACQCRVERVSVFAQRDLESLGRRLLRLRQRCGGEKRKSGEA